MTLLVIDKGNDNSVIIDPDVLAQGEGTIVLNGSGITVKIAAGCSLSKANVILGNNCSFKVDQECRLAALEVVAESQASVSIGSGTNFTWHTRLFLHEPAHIRIGSGCLIASETLFSVSDMHSIIDRTSGRRINPPTDIVLEDRVWIAHSATVLKGSQIGAGSVIGLNSVVTGKIAAYSLAIGQPAKVVRENISWLSELLPV